MKFSRIAKFLLIIALGFFLFMGISLVSGGSHPVLAQENATVTPTPAPTAEAPAMSGGGHSDCLGCHSNPRLVGKFTNGETLSLYYDETQHAGSVHDERGLGCRACHADQGNYPHPMSSDKSCTTCHSNITGGTDSANSQQLVFDIPLENPRALSLELNQACMRCHQTQSQEVMDSAHERIQANGNPYAPVCLDCHGSHDVKPVSEVENPKVCSKCHLAVYTAYESSVHGAALEANGNPDVPTCGTCHGIHVVKGPDEANFRADSIELCGKCHADDNLMAKYGISTNVFTTYLDDFHGRSVDFSRQSKMQVDKATCYDCHGVHNILPPQDKASTVYPANLLHTCQRCHPDADITFPQAWLSHKVPDWTNAPLLYAVNLTYIILVPAVIGGFLIYIALDAYHRISTRRKKTGHK
jgi:predicted CXXCH cytochrome family protein